MSDSETWTAVDDFILETAVRPGPEFAAATRAADEADIPPIAVSAPQGKFLALLVSAIRARSVLEIGTLAGYSTMWMAGALPADGKLTTLELDRKHADVAAANLARAGLADKVEIVLGRALETLQDLTGPYDLAFIDADKINIPAYFDRCVELLRPGGVIVVDNVVRQGKLADSSSTDPSVIGVRTFHQQLVGRVDVDATTLQTVGGKSYDGFTMAVKR
jgi:predicted O-methyltransferase YrrM